MPFRRTRNELNITYVYTSSSRHYYVCVYAITIFLKCMRRINVEIRSTSKATKPKEVTFHNGIHIEFTTLLL